MSREATARSPEDLAQERRDRAELRRKAFSLLMTAVLGSLVVFTITGERGAIALYRKWQERKSLGAEIEALRAENARKERENRRIASDPAAVEPIAREQLDMLKPGEIMFVLPDEP